MPEMFIFSELAVAFTMFNPVAFEFEYQFAGSAGSKGEVTFATMDVHLPSYAPEVEETKFHSDPGRVHEHLKCKEAVLISFCSSPLIASMLPEEGSVKLTVFVSVELVRDPDITEVMSISFTYI